MAAEEPGDDAPEPDDAPDGAPSGPPPDPLDRAWVHPTELHSFVAAPEAPAHEARPREWVVGITSALVGALVTVLVLVAFGALGGRHRAAVPPPVVSNPSDVVDYAVANRVATVVAPSVVTVRIGNDTDPLHPAGSGVVVRSDRVITNAHLLNGATKVDVVADSGDVHTAKLVGTDPQTDLAVLDVAGSGLTVANLSSTTGLHTGQTAITVTAAAVVRYAVAINVVSDVDQMADVGTGIAVAGLVKVGIPSTPDMAGGALVDSEANVVGILTYPVAGPDDSSLVVPVSVVRDVEDQLDSSGKVSHGWIGVAYGPDPTDPPSGGAKVATVFPGTPAQKAGIQVGDVITRAGGKPVSGRADAIAAARALRPQDPLDLVYVHDDHAHSTTVNVGTPAPTMLALPGLG